MSNSLTITSYNIRKAVGVDWKRKPARILQVLGETGADIAVLQEADKRLGPRHSVFDRDKLQKDYGYTIAPLADNEVSLGWHGNAILVKKPIKIIAAAHLKVPHFEPRGAVSVLLDVGDGRRLEIIGVHFGLMASSRKKQLQFMHDYALARDQSVALIVGGDFNEWNPDEHLDGQFGEALTTISPGDTFHTSHPRAALDHFVISPSVQSLDAHVHITELSKKASDHFPIVMRFSLGKN